MRITPHRVLVLVDVIVRSAECPVEGGFQERRRYIVRTGTYREETDESEHVETQRQEVTIVHKNTWW